MNNQKIDAFLQDRLDEYIALTSQLCAQPSVSATNEGVRECSVLVAEILHDRGFEVQTFETEGQPIIVGRAEGDSDRTLLFYNHYDVQPPEPLELWTTPPFDPTIRDGALYARGAKDDKGEFICRLAAVEAAREANAGKLPCNIIFLIEGQEEIGSPHIKQFIDEHLDLVRCDAAIWEEGGVDNQDRPATRLGTRGILAVQLSITTAGRDAHSGGAHNLPSSIWRLVWALNTLKDQNERVLISGFYDDAKPMSDLDKDLTDRYFDADERRVYREQLGLKQWLRGLPDDDPQLDYNVFEPTCNIQGITSGYQGEGMKTIVPAHASAKLDFRLVPDQDPKDIFAKLRAHLDAQGFEDIELKWNGAMWPYKATPDHPFIQMSREAAQEVYNTEMKVFPMNGGSSPMYTIDGPFKVPIIAPGLGYPNSSTHAPDEHFRLSDFLKAARHIARIVDGFAGLS